MFDKNTTGSQRWKTVLLDLIMWLIDCNFVCFFPILLIWQMAQPSSGSTHTSEYKELIQRLRSSTTPTQPKGHWEPSSSLQSLRRAVRLCTPGKPSQGNWALKQDKTRAWNQNLESSTSVCLLLFIHSDLCSPGNVQQHVRCFTVSTTSGEHGGPRGAETSDSEGVRETLKRETPSNLKSVNGLRVVF